MRPEPLSFFDMHDETYRALDMDQADLKNGTGQGVSVRLHKRFYVLKMPQGEIIHLALQAAIAL